MSWAYTKGAGVNHFFADNEVVSLCGLRYALKIARESSRSDVPECQLCTWTKLKRTRQPERKTSP